MAVSALRIWPEFADVAFRGGDLVIELSLSHVKLDYKVPERFRALMVQSRQVVSPVWEIVPSE